MGSGSNPSSIKEDLFSAQQPPDASSPSASQPIQSPVRTDKPGAGTSPSYALPINLPNALKYLDHDQLDRLLSAVISELKQRGKTFFMSDEPSRKQRTKEVAPPLTLGKLNAVRAAFKAGVRPSRIAKQFGISQSDLRKALWRAIHRSKHGCGNAKEQTFCASGVTMRQMSLLVR
jgi:hypothetical protein